MRLTTNSPFGGFRGLLLLLWGVGGLFESLFAQATVTPLSVDYDRHEVTFRVAWSGTAANNRVWMFVDLCPVAGTSPGTFAKAIISGATATAGSIDPASLNGRGFYVTTNPSTVTATLSNATGKFNWCAYGSDYPPNVTANSGVYTLRGTPPFTLIAASGTPTQKVSGTTITTSAVTITPITLTDETGYPGDFCIYAGSDLLIDATHLCQQRAGGAQNWEAYIKDTRDNELYRIVLMPDNKWWLAQNLKYAPNGQLRSGCDKDSCGRFYKQSDVFKGNYAVNQQRNCPPGWVLPSITQWTALTTSINSTLTVAWRDLRSLQAPCTPKTDRYGWATRGRSANLAEPNEGDSWFAPSGTACAYAGLDNGDSSNATCNSTTVWLGGVCADTYPTAIRCIRP
jgi:uncharacterized protein (TIGR02145 family)